MRARQIERNVEFQMAIQKQEFSKLIKDARVSRGLTQEKLAGLLDVTAKTYGEWERVPGSWPRPSQYDKLAEVLGLSREALLGPMENAGQVGSSARLDEIARLAAENNVMLRAVLAHLGISVETLSEPPADLLATLGNGQAKGAKRRRSV